MKTKKILSVLLAAATMVSFLTTAKAGEVDLNQFESAADKVHDILGGGNSYSKVNADGPYLVKGEAGKQGTLKWVVTSDSRGKKPMANQLQIALNRYFDSVDPTKISIESKGDNIKRGDRIVKDKAAVERTHKFEKGILIFDQKINFKASWGHFNTGFPQTEIHVQGVIAKDVELKKEEKK